METLAFQPSAAANDTLDTIFTRRSVRKYKPQLLERTILEKIIEAGRMAPSAMNRQPWSFYILTDHEQIAMLSKEITRTAAIRFAKQGMRQLLKSAVELYQAYKSTDFKWSEDAVFHGAPAVIFLTAPADNEWAATDVGMCVQNMLLAACSLGVSGCPVGMGRIVEYVKDYKRLRIPENERVVIAVVFGYADEHPVMLPRRKNNVFFLNED
ncbi:MAG: hypothetical protein RL213_2165 [Bacteroidota bacterium]|jgi:nitroreductase